MSKKYIGSQEHWEDSVNADHDKREEIQKDQEDNRTKDFYDEMKSREDDIVEDFWTIPEEKIYTTDEVWDLYRNDKDFFFTSFSDFAKSNGFVFIKQLKK